MLSLSRTPRFHILMTLASLTIVMQALSTSARAEIQITGEPDAIKVEAKEASVEDVLITLNKAFDLQYRSSANLSRSVSGTFTGSLQQVVSRVLLLEGYNFVSESSANGVMIAVYNMGAAPGGNVNPQPATTASTPRQAPPAPAPEVPGGNVGRKPAHAMPRPGRQMIQFLQHRFHQPP
jgi:hypothetical protein